MGCEKRMGEKDVDEYPCRRKLVITCYSSLRILLGTNFLKQEFKIKKKKGFYLCQGQSKLLVFQIRDACPCVLYYAFHLFHWLFLFFQFRRQYLNRILIHLISFSGLI